MTEYKVIKSADDIWAIIKTEDYSKLDIELHEEEFANKLCKIVEEAWRDGYGAGHGHGYSNAALECC